MPVHWSCQTNAQGRPQSRTRSRRRCRRGMCSMFDARRVTQGPGGSCQGLARAFAHQPLYPFAIAVDNHTTADAAVASPPHLLFSQHPVAPCRASATATASSAASAPAHPCDAIATNRGSTSSCLDLRPAVKARSRYPGAASPHEPLTLPASRHRSPSCAAPASPETSTHPRLPAIQQRPPSNRTPTAPAHPPQTHERAAYDPPFQHRDCAPSTRGERADDLHDGAQTMPGIVTMNHSATDSARDGENNKRSLDGKFVNGVDGRKDPAAMNGSMDKSTNGALPAATAPPMDQYSELPPAITHIGPEAYHPLSKLLARVAQECYNALEDTLHKMSGMSLGQQTNGAMTNGVAPQDNPEVNKQKKLLLLKFAQENRAKFIKLLVLTEWGQKSAYDIAKVIDLYSWAKEQAAHMDFVDEQVNQIKILSAYARENNPDIRTALEILSTGKASWIPTVRMSINCRDHTVLTDNSWITYRPTPSPQIRRSSSCVQ